MDLSLTSTQEILRDSARDFLTQECPRSFVRDVDETETGFSPELWQKMSELGWVGMVLPEQYGGGGSSFMDLAVLSEEMGSACLSTPLHSSAVLGGLSILDAGSDQLKQEVLPSVASGQRILSFAQTEPDYGWGPESVNLAATKKNGSFVLNGTKLFIPDAQVADQIVLVARTSTGASPDQGITLFLVNKNTPGVSTRIIKGWTGDKLNEITFENAEVPASSVIGQVDGGWPTVERVLDRAGIIQCAYIVGGLQRILDITVEYSKNRIAFGVPIGTFQRVQDWIIVIVNDLEASRWTTNEALWKLDDGRPDANLSIAMAQVVASEGYPRSAEAAHHVHAGIGIDKEYGLYLYTKKARSLLSYLGDPVYHRQRVAKFLDM
ncbi:acyl-CoA dehydrogenase [SAR202 cluster bacterium AC-647-N09_OGT_505m]|nr:acyl-CoA dehydrogenase [SAR202 cluster bacterium AC-647-N09_OGT_505m]